MAIISGTFNEIKLLIKLLNKTFINTQNLHSFLIRSYIMYRTTILSLVLLLIAFSSIAKKAPNDRGVYAKSATMQTLYNSMQGAIKKARRTYPKAKAKFLNGLPAGQYFFVVTRLRDKNGVVEQVFISVSEIKNGTIFGYIYNKIQNVSGYEFRQSYSFPESEIYDWLITKPNGSQTGNYIGKQLQTRKF